MISPLVAGAESAIADQSVSISALRDLTKHLLVSVMGSRCILTGMPGHDMHEWMVRRGAGVPLAKQRYIFHPYNCVILNHARHDAGISRADTLLIAERVVPVWGEEAMRAWYDALPLRTKPQWGYWERP